MDPALAEPEDPVDPAPLADWVPLLGLTSVPFEAAEFDAGELAGELAGDLDADELALADADADADALTLGLVVLVGVGLGLPQGVPVALAVVLPAVLLLAAAEADVLALFVGVLVAVGVTVVVALLVALLLSLGPALLLLAAGLLLVPPTAGLAAEAGGATLGVTDLPALAAADDEDEEADGHRVTFGLLDAMAVLPWLRPPAGEPTGVPEPATLAVPLVLRGAIPADWPSWTRA